MSFMDNLSKLAGHLFGEGEHDPQAVADRVKEDVGSWDSADLGDHFQQSIGSMDRGTLATLGQHIMSAFEQHGADASAAAASAGVDPQDIAAGDPAALSSIVDMAKNNPDVFRDAASNFLSNPGSIGQMAPGFVSEIVSRLQKN